MELLTLTEAAERAGVTPGALRLAIRDERLAAVKRGRDWFVTAAELDRYISQRRTWHKKSVAV